jgi:predicted methyltransferase MtxX (methanogen marker protein 4)
VIAPDGISNLISGHYVQSAAAGYGAPLVKHNIVYVDTSGEAATNAICMASALCKEITC